MKFYVARTVEAGAERRQLHHRKDEAKAVDCNFEQIDIPTDMPGLKAFVQALYDEIDTLKDQILEGGEQLPEPSPALNVETFPEGLTAPPPTLGDADFVEDEDRFDASILESQVEALGVLGEKGLAFFDGWSATCGVSAGFARGVALLNVIAADEHQLARIFLRERLRKRKQARVA